MCRLQINAARPHAKTFAPHCAASKDYKNKPYNAPTIHRAWSQTIAKRVTKCRFVLFSMSPGFFIESLNMNIVMITTRGPRRYRLNGYG